VVQVGALDALEADAELRGQVVEDAVAQQLARLLAAQLVLVKVHLVRVRELAPVELQHGQVDQLDFVKQGIGLLVLSDMKFTFTGELLS